MCWVSFRRLSSWSRRAFKRARVQDKSEYPRWSNCTSKGFDRYSSAVRQCTSGITGPDHGVLTNARIIRENERYRSGTSGVYLKAPFEGLRRVGRGNPSIASPPTVGRCDGSYAMNGCYRARGNSSIESWQSTSAVGTTRALCFQRIP